METSSSKNNKKREGFQEVDIVLQKLKKYLGVGTNRELSDILGVKSNTLSTWKKRKSMDYERIISVCRSYEIDINKLFFNNENLSAISQGKNREKGFSVVLRDSYYPYVANLHNTSYIDTLPRFDFPFVVENNVRAFQMVGSGMYPLVKDGDFVIGEYMDEGSRAIINEGVYVLVSNSRGIFISQVKIDINNPDVICLVNDNRMLIPDVKMQNDEIVELWKVTSVFSLELIGKHL